MSWLDDLTKSVFGPSSDVSPQASPLPMPMPSPSAGPPMLSQVSLYDPNARLSNSYLLKNLTVTDQALSAPNLPQTASQFNNLVTVAEALEYLESVIGPVRILSGFRTKELQNALTQSGDPTSSSTSFHELGRAIDFVPTTMNIDEYFGKMLANEDVKSMFAEIAYKPGQGSIHAAVNVPGDVRQTKILGLNENNVYARLGLDEIANFIKPYIDSAEDAYDYAAANLVTTNKMPLIITAVVGLGGAAYLLLMSKPKTKAS